MLPIKKETEMRTQSIPEVVITEERDPNPTRPVHQPPTLITPPSVDPGVGGISPPGGGTSLPPPAESLKTCAVNCNCSMGPKISLTDEHDDNCPDKIYYTYSGSLTRHFEIKAADCGLVDNKTTCNNGEGYNGYTLRYTVYKNIGCKDLHQS